MICGSAIPTLFYSPPPLVSCSLQICVNGANLPEWEANFIPTHSFTVIH